VACELADNPRLGEEEEKYYTPSFLGRKLRSGFPQKMAKIWKRRISDIFPLPTHRVGKGEGRCPRCGNGGVGCDKPPTSGKKK